MLIFKRNNAHSEWMKLFMERVDIVCNWILCGMILVTLLDQGIILSAVLT